MRTDEVSEHSLRAAATWARERGSGNGALIGAEAAAAEQKRALAGLLMTADKEYRPASTLIDIVPEGAAVRREPGRAADRSDPAGNQFEGVGACRHGSSRIVLRPGTVMPIGPCPWTHEFRSAGLGMHRGARGSGCVRQLADHGLAAPQLNRQLTPPVSLPRPSEHGRRPPQHRQERSAHGAGRECSHRQNQAAGPGAGE
jgi:hypothetical protein